MRRVDVATGIVQRINDILGRGDDGDLTDWSIQSAMLENMDAFGKAMNGGSGYGRVLEGLIDDIQLGSTDPWHLVITRGYGVTPLGKIILIPDSNYISPPKTNGVTFHLYAKYLLVQSSWRSPGFIETGVLNSDEVVDLAYDEKGAVLSYLTQQAPVLVSYEPPGNDDSLCYLASGEWDTDHYVITRETDMQGFDGKFKVNVTYSAYSLEVREDLTIIDYGGGLIMSNGIGTLTRRVRLNADGTGVIIEEL